jgi:hypothetical protein
VLLLCGLLVDEELDFWRAFGAIFSSCCEVLLYVWTVCDG